ncbi:MAG: bifunctional phosphoribosyl-AMP cyclohydrolase/phosphoribosyl-ATP diphosphatase HisIE [Bacteroidetes bacterium]|nr:bifunctional phosphoribosyl-AMP cyclohydrolase/phosphoribosyl-ATP diphosphatase HisIE [Bacteroidota bacterium]
MTVDFSKADGLVPAIVQDSKTKNVLMLGYMNEAALQKTEAERRVTFYSRSKKRLWTKGEESGHYLHVESIQADCDNDTLLIQASPRGPVCHTGTDTCWGEENKPHPLQFIAALEGTIADRQLKPSSESYTSRLFEKGINKIAQKVGEEAVELVIEAKDSHDELFLNEAADLLFHYLILLQAKGKNLGDVTAVLQSRVKG